MALCYVVMRIKNMLLCFIRIHIVEAEDDGFKKRVLTHSRR